jgi:hypothetical protein
MALLVQVRKYCIQDIFFGGDKFSLTFSCFFFRASLLTVMILFYTFFPSVVTRIALTLSCQKFGNRSLLSEALSMQCWSSQHWEAIMYVGLPGLLLYVVVIPTGLAQKLIYRRKSQTLYVHQTHYDPKWTLRYGFVFAGYKEGYEWWESVIMLRKCCFVVLSIFLQTYGTTPQVVAASMVLSAALSLQLQYRPFADDDHNFLESIGLHACLVQLLVALLSNSVGKIDSNTLGAVSTAVLVFTMFGSTLFFSGWTTRMTIQSSQETEGVVGMIAKACGSGCGTKRVDTGRTRIDQSVVISRLPERNDAHVYAVLKLQEHVRLSVLKQKTANDKAEDTATVVNMVQKTASEQAQLKKKELEGRKMTAMLRLNTRLEKRKSRAKITPLRVVPVHVHSTTD